MPSPDLQLSDLRARKHDLVLARVVQPFSERDEIAVETLFNDRVVVVAHRNSRWARRRRIKLEELVDEDWMLTPTNSWVHSRVIDAFRDKGLKPPTPSLLTLSIPLRVHLLAGTDCLTAFASSVFRLNTARYELTSLPVDLPRRPWPAVAVTLKNRTLHPLAEHFLECAREVARPLTQ